MATSRGISSSVKLVWCKPLKFTPCPTTDCKATVIFATLMLAGGLGIQGAHAQTAPSQAASASAGTTTGSELQEIIVTAEKRDTDLQTTPIAITALSGETLDLHQIRDLFDLQTLVPNFKMGAAQGIAQINIRGIGGTDFLPGYEGEVAVNLNQVYVSRPISQEAGLFDVADIEVLRGPQGTLYGRNATGGAVNVATTLPTNELTGDMHVTAGNFDEVRLEGGIGGPIADNLLLRVAGFRDYHDGYGNNVITHNEVDDKDQFGFRGTLMWTPMSSLKATLYAEYTDEHDHQGAFHYFGAAGTTGIPGALELPPLFQVQGGFAPANSRDVANQLDPQFHLQTTALTGVLDWDNDAFSVKSITGYRKQESAFLFDLDGGSELNAFEVEGEQAHQVSEELQLHYDTNTLHLTAGGYYFHEVDAFSPGQVVVSEAVADVIIPGFFAAPTGLVTLGDENATLTTNAGAAFGQATYSITEAFSVTAGVRYSIETKRIVDQFVIDIPSFPPYPGANPIPPGTVVPSATFDSTTPKFGAQYQIDPNTFVYASYSQGFKSGGFDVAVANPKPFQPEKLTDYEIGIKTMHLNHRLRVDLDGFYYDYKDLQVNQIVGITNQTGNAATARDYGVEAETDFQVTDALLLSATSAWTHARYGHYCGPDPALPALATPTSCAVNGVLPASEADYAGHALNNAPDYQATFDAQYSWKIGSDQKISLRGETEYSSRFYFTPGNHALLSQTAYVKGNAFLTYDISSSWALTGYVRNMGDTTTKTSAFTATPFLFNPVVGSLAPPRLIGIEVRYLF